MPGHKTLGRTRSGAPLGTFVLTVIAGIETEAADDAEDVTAFGINSDPFTGAWPAITAKGVRRRRRAKLSRIVQHIGGCAGTIVTAFLKTAMASTVDIRFSL